jgi:hypothetical protein
MAALLECPNAKEGTCPKSDPIIQKQTQKFCTFFCKTCKTMYVETFPNYDDEAKNQNYRKRIAEIEQKQRAQESRRKIFT